MGDEIGEELLISLEDIYDNDMRIDPKFSFYFHTLPVDVSRIKRVFVLVLIFESEKGG